MLKAFYESVLPRAGRFCLWQKVQGPEWHTWYETIDELVAETERRINTQGLYFGTAGFGDMVQEDETKPNHGEFVRKLDNVVALRAFRFDIDAGVEKHTKHPNDAYPTQQDAKAALVAFIKATGFMPTFIVSSGEGLHVYWCLTEDVTREWWTPLARDMNAAGRAQGLKVDGGITVDAARILRPIGTPHKNGSRVTILLDSKKFYTPAEITELIRRHAPQVEDDFPAARPPARRAGINDDVLKVEGPPSSLARVAEHCTAVGLMRDQTGNVPEPHWRAVMGVAKYCEDGPALIHAWSAGYDGYSKRETQEKLDRWETPPTTCQHFSLMHDGCRTCQFRSKITTPKQLGYMQVEPVTPAPAIPDATSATSTDSLEAPAPAAPTGPAGFALPDEPMSEDCPVPDRPDLFDEAGPFFYKVVDNRWTLYHQYKEKTKDATGQEVWLNHVKPVAYKLFWVDSNSLPGATDAGGVLLTFGRVERPGTTRQDRMDMPAGVTADLKALCKWLADQGINLAPRSLNSKAADHIMEYVSREKIRKQNDMRFVIKERFGYHFHEGQFICSMGQYTVYPNGEIVKTICNTKLKGLAGSLTTTALSASPGGRWDATEWRALAPNVTEYIKFLRNHYGHAGYELARLAIAINLASPFLVFAADSVFNEAEDMPSTGFILSLYSEASGIGKSSLMAAIAAAYGKDSLARKGNDASITAVAAATLAKGTAVYPFLLDEVTQNDANRTAQLIDTFANGIGRVRATSDGSVARPAATWALVSTVATNVPQRELLTATQKRSDALLMRLMELNFDAIPPAGDIEAFREDLKKVQMSCGAFGLFQALLSVKAGNQRLTEMTANNVTKAFSLLGVDQKFRFFARMLGAMLTAQELLGKWAPFDMDELITTFKTAIKDTVWYVQANRNTIGGDLGALLAHVAPNVAVTKTWTRRVKAGDPHDVLLNQNVRLPLLGREVQEWGCVYIEANAVRSWCLENQMAASAFLNKAQQANLLMEENGELRQKLRLTTGLLGMPTTMGYYYKFRTRAAVEGTGDNVVELRPAERPADPPESLEDAHV